MGEVREEYTAENYPSFGKKYAGEKAIISLTSWRARINTVSKTLFSLLKQCPDFHIVLVLSEEEFPKKEKELPENLMVFVENELIELLWAKLNLKPHKKFFYTMQKYRNVPIITCDDDQIINKNFAEILYNSYLKNPNVIHAGRCHLILKDRNNNILPYKQWIWNCKTIKEPSFELFATGVGTILYPPNILKISNDDIPMIKKLINQDDIFLKIKENNLNIKIKSVGGINLGIDLKEISTMQKEALNKINTMNQNMNDILIKEYKHFFK